MSNKPAAGRQEKKVALITGCSSGFGALIAKELLQKDFTVWATMRESNGRNEKSATELRTWQEKRGAQATGLLNLAELDVTNHASIASVAKKIEHQDGRIDVVVNNAGVGIGCALEACSAELVQKIFAINTFGPLAINQAFLPMMRQQKSGLLIQISSTLGRLQYPFFGLYSASKAAAEALSEGLSYDLNHFGIDSTIVEPGGFPTGIGAKMISADKQEVMSSYGEDYIQSMTSFFQKMGASFDVPNPPDPIEVAKKVVELIEMQPGKRPLRTVVGKVGSGGVARLNETQVACQAEFMVPFL